MLFDQTLDLQKGWQEVPFVLSTIRFARDDRNTQVYLSGVYRICQFLVRIKRFEHSGEALEVINMKSRLSAIVLFTSSGPLILGSSSTFVFALARLRFTGAVLGSSCASEGGGGSAAACDSNQFCLVLSS